VVKQLYTLVISPSNGSASTPAGTPYGVTATLTAAGNAPVANANITFTVPSGDTATTWSSDTSSPTSTGPTSITATTNSQGQATVEAAFEPNLGNQTVQATFTTDDVTADLSVAVSANQPSTVTWNTPSPDPVHAGSSFVTTATLVDGYGFPLAAGEPVTVAFASDANQTWTTVAGGVIGQGHWFTPSLAGTYQVVIFNVDGTAYNQSGDPTLPDVSETVNPGPMQYFYPAFGLANNTTGTWFQPYSWTNSNSLSQGPTNFINYQGQFVSNPPINGSTYSVAGFGVDAYDNPIYSGTSATLSCSAWNGGSCPGLPSTANSGWQNVGPFRSGSYNLVYTPHSGPDGVTSSPTTTYDQFNIPGLRGWNVEVGNGSSIIGSCGPGQNIALGTLPSGENSLNFSIEGLNQNNGVFTGYTNNGTDQEGMICTNATNGGVCPNGVGNPLAATISLGSGGSPNGYTGWSNLTTFQPGTYRLSVRAGEYGDAGGQNWMPTWNNTTVTFTVQAEQPSFTSVSLSYALLPIFQNEYGVPSSTGGYNPAIELTFHGMNFGNPNVSSEYAIQKTVNWTGAFIQPSATVTQSAYPSVEGYQVVQGASGTWWVWLAEETPWISLDNRELGIYGPVHSKGGIIVPQWTATTVSVVLPYYTSNAFKADYNGDVLSLTNPESGLSSICQFNLPTSFVDDAPSATATVSCHS